MRRAIIRCGIGLGALWLAAFAAFAGAALWFPVGDGAAADCAVLFTGRHGRAVAAIEALSERPPRRLLISGFGMGMGHRELAELQTMAPDFFTCCVDIEAAARNTVGNGREAARWARRRSCRDLALITDDVHMPRAYLALRRRLDAIAILPRPVRYLPSLPPARAVPQAVAEYHKTLAAMLLGLRPDGEERPAQ